MRPARKSLPVESLEDFAGITRRVAGYITKSGQAIPLAIQLPMSWHPRVLGNRRSDSRKLLVRALIPLGNDSKATAKQQQLQNSRSKHTSKYRMSQAAATPPAGSTPTLQGLHPPCPTDLNVFKMPSLHLARHRDQRRFQVHHNRETGKQTVPNPLSSC